MADRIELAGSRLAVHPLCLGGNVFGWSADREESFRVLDAYAERGGNFIDTADVYSEWAPGHVGGESESIIGAWMQSRGNRAEMVIATKVAKLSKRPGLSASNISAAAQESLDRLQTEWIDLYWAHEDDAATPLEETLSAFDALVRQGNVRAIGASNYTAARLREAARVSAQHDLTAFSALQNHYNLVSRQAFETEMAPAVADLGLANIPYFALARGFLTGKYRKGSVVESVRAQGTVQWQTDDGWALLDGLDLIAARHGVAVSAVALAWLRAKGAIPIASARTTEQLAEIMPIVTLDSADIAELDRLSAGF